MFSDEDQSPRYKIWSIRASWTNINKEGERVKNGTGFKWMPKDQSASTQENTEAHAREWWDKYIERMKQEKPEHVKEIEDIQLAASFSHEESWCDGWFKHWTWDIGQSDEEALESFQQYVWRIEVLNERWRWENGKSEDESKICLMGAEDRWRWVSDEEDEDGKRKPAPCRCDGCKKAGVIRIVH